MNDDQDMDNTISQTRKLFLIKMDFGA